MAGSPNVLQGTLDLLVLKPLLLAPLHGWGISQRIHSCRRTRCRSARARSCRRCIGSEKKGLINGEWATTEANREAK